MIEIWDKANTALNLIADAIRDKAKDKPTRETLIKARDNLRKVDLEIGQMLMDKNLK